LFWWLLSIRTQNTRLLYISPCFVEEWWTGGHVRHRIFDESQTTARHGILLQPARVCGLMRNNIFNYYCLNNNYGNVQVYEVYAVPRVRLRKTAIRREGVRGLRDSQSYVPCSRISPTAAGSVITGGGGGRCDFLRIFLIRFKCVPVASRLRIYARVIAGYTSVSKTIWSRVVIIKRGILDSNYVIKFRRLRKIVY